MNARFLSVSAVQMQSGSDRGRNLQAAEHWVRLAAATGAKLVVLPEQFDGLGPARGGDAISWKREFAALRGQEESSLDCLRKLAGELGIYLCAGSILYRRTRHGGVTNSSFMFTPQGRQLAGRYDKRHLAKVRKGRVEYGETGVVAGRRAVAWTLHFSEARLRVRAAVGICFDLRFPEMFRALTRHPDARLILLPSAFYAAYGPAHWEALIRARAIENHAYVIAPDQCGQGGDGRRYHGHSMIVDPLGRVLSQRRENRPGLVSASLDLQLARRLRDEIPSYDAARANARTRRP